MSNQYELSSHIRWTFYYAQALMLEAAPGYSFDDTLTGAEVRDSGETYKGTHGYLPTDPRMRASLIIYGPGVRSGAKLPLARMIDLRRPSPAC